MSLSDLVVTDALIPRPAPHENHSALLPLTLAILLHAAIVAAFLAYVPRPLPLVDEPLTVTMIFAAAAPPAPPQPKAQPGFPSPPAATPPSPKPAPPQPAPEPAAPAVLREPHPVAPPPVKRVPSPPKRAARAVPPRVEPALALLPHAATRPGIASRFHPGRSRSKPRPVQRFIRHQPARHPERRYPARPAYPAAAATAQHSNAPPTPATPVSTPISAGWRTELITWLARHKTYPEAARRDGIQGRVVVRFTAARDGRVETIALLQSSGQRILDDAAETMLRHARLPPFPASMPQRSITVTLPLTYHLEN